ncbi:MAG TPA: hypothetical protein VIN60_03430 [Anaerolineales bacterium]
MYIDPNTGGILFGWLLGAFGLIVGLLLVFSGKIRAYFAQLRRKMRKDKTEDEE